MNTSSLLIEIFLEELPFSSIKKEIKNIKPKFEKLLNENSLSVSDIEFFWTPRRLILTSKNFPLMQEGKTLEYFGPPLNIAYDKDNNPSQPTISFLKKLNINIDDLQTSTKNGKECLYYKTAIEGKKSKFLLENIILDFLDILSFGKSMQWGSVESSFIRPIRNIFVLLDDRFIELKKLENKYQFSQTKCIYPHRSKEAKEINNAHEYFKFLESNGVIYDQEMRKELILAQIQDIEKEKNIKVEIDSTLLDEVVAITEYPNALYGKFDEKFLELPNEVIITSMKINQKYFATYKNNISNNSDAIDLNNGFIVVCNSFDKSAFDEILKGNQKVLKARLEDALFFYKNDFKSFIQDKIDERLKKIEFIQGSMFDKVEREIKIATILCGVLKLDSTNIIKAIMISKNDLLSEMVGEFGELQGIMGSYYTKDDALKLMIKEQYLPLQEDSLLPSSPKSAIISISNKLDSILSLFALDKIPSGSKDPFALRRAAIGIIKMIVKFDIPLNLFDIFPQLESNYKKIDENKIFQFFCERLEGTLNVNQSIINAAIKSNQKDLVELVRQIDALKSIPNDFKILFKRIANILKNVEIKADSINRDLFVCDEERVLFEVLEKFKSFDIQTPKNRIEKLLEFKEILQEFFDNVMINIDDSKIKENRILLVNSIYKEFFKVGDIKEISF